MVMFATDEPNDRDLIRELGSRVVACAIPYGDIVFFGQGETSIVKVVVERKKVPDMISCVTTGRYLNQAQAAKEDGADHLVVILEGQYRANLDDGLVEIPGWAKIRKRPGWIVTTPAITYSRLCQYLFELCFLAGIIVVRSHDVKETAAIIKALYDNFQTPPEKHASLHQIFTQPTQHVELVRPNLVRRVSAQLSGIGWERSRAVAATFKSVRDMCDADEKCWRDIEGIGKKTAEKVVRELRGE